MSDSRVGTYVLLTRSPLASRFARENPKFEILNPKQYQNSKFKTVLNFGHLDFGFV